MPRNRLIYWGKIKRLGSAISPSIAKQKSDSDRSTWFDHRAALSGKSINSTKNSASYQPSIELCVLCEFCAKDEFAFECETHKHLWRFFGDLRNLHSAWFWL